MISRTRSQRPPRHSRPPSPLAPGSLGHSTCCLRPALRVQYVASTLAHLADRVAWRRSTAGVRSQAGAATRNLSLEAVGLARGGGRGSMGNDFGKRLLEYGGAVLAVAGAVLIRGLLDPWLGDDLPLATLF